MKNRPDQIFRKYLYLQFYLNLTLESIFRFLRNSSELRSIKNISLLRHSMYNPPQAPQEERPTDLTVQQPRLPQVKSEQQVPRDSEPPAFHMSEHFMALHRSSAATESLPNNEAIQFNIKTEPENQPDPQS